MSLALYPMAVLARYTRSSMLDVLRTDYMRTARSKGLGEQRHPAPPLPANALLPVVTIAGIVIADIATGSFFVETIYQVPGVGRYFVQSITGRDYPVILGTVLLLGFVVSVMNLLVDLSTRCSTRGSAPGDDSCTEENELFLLRRRCRERGRCKHRPYKRRVCPGHAVDSAIQRIGETVVAEPATIGTAAAQPPVGVLVRRTAPRGSGARHSAALLRSRLAVIAGILLILLVLLAVFAPFVTPYDYTAQDYSALTQPPSREHWLGTDDLGRDILSRLIFGARISLAVGLVVQGVILLIGVPAGLIAAHFGGKIDTVIMRLVDSLYSIPSLLFVIVIMTFLRATFASARRRLHRGAGHRSTRRPAGSSASSSASV